MEERGKKRWRKEGRNGDKGVVIEEERRGGEGGGEGRGGDIRFKCKVVVQVLGHVEL